MIGTDVFQDPDTHLFDHFIIIGVAGHHQVDHFKMDILIVQGFKCVEYGLEAAAVEPAVNVVAVSLEVDGGAVQHFTERQQRLLVDIAVGDPQVEYAVLPGQAGRIDHVLEKGDGLRVGIGD